ncbi:Ankyrin repeats containing protein [Cardinium endosymbiont of Sogatella furcifera]|uniref:ankyrin repeat domain-containing protein n=1 Tax=Cardinium endosymbiont of Sogatella furcifera TaxID=650378 RepID=UPI000E0D9D66|nr:ankyrin repeat domain-containing protein [Cardinium endosymbiont of Sogatella furcifera]AXI24519.1 Ankyrin repeats containing protein [Cardinium endosymbiont of Sogatella furcifera]
MHIYTHYRRVGLFIGLCSLPILSACVSTRSMSNHLGLSNIDSNNNSLDIGVSLIRTDRYTSTMPATGTTPSSNIITPQEAFIINAIAKSPAGLIPNRHRQLSNWVTNEAPSNSVALENSILDNKILEEKILEDIRSSGFSIKRTKYWLDQGLNIDAKHTPTGWSLLIYGVQYDKKDLVRYLLAKGANVDIQDIYEFTPLMNALLVLDGAHMTEDMINLLIQYKANPFIKDIYGSNAASIAKSMDRLYGSNLVKILSMRRV